ncbi:MAG: hypothetical protein SPG96_05775 [Succinivibrio sp.]|nr:hypothetical protein [Succinivibrio sp.]
MLTGFVKADDNKIEAANKSFTISMGQSPFQDRVTFKVTGFTYKQAENDGKVDAKASVNPVLITTVGDMFLSMALKMRVDAEGKILEPNGTFNHFIKDIIGRMAGKSNGEILTAIVDGCKDKEVVVSRQPYVAITKDGRKFAASLVILDFKD